MTDENQLLQQLEEIKIELQKAPEDPSLLHDMGVGYHLLGQHVNAIIQLEKAICVEPRKSVYHFNLGNAFSENQQPEKAIKAYLDAIEIDPGHIPSLNNLADVYETVGEVNKAFELFTYLVKLSPDEALTHFNLGNFYLRQNQHIEAVKCYEKALEKDGQFTEAYFNIAWILYRAKAYKKAQEYAVKGLRTDSSRDDLKKLLSDIQRNMN